MKGFRAGGQDAVPDAPGSRAPTAAWASAALGSQEDRGYHQATRNRVPQGDRIQESASRVEARASSNWRRYRRW